MKNQINNNLEEVVSRATQDIEEGEDIGETLGKYSEFMQQPATSGEHDIGILTEPSGSAAKGILDYQEDFTSRLADAALEGVRGTSSRLRKEAEEKYISTIMPGTALAKEFEKDRSMQSFLEGTLGPIQQEQGIDPFTIRPDEVFDFIGGNAYARHDTFLEGRDNEHYHALRQTTGEKARRGGIKFLTGLSTAFVGSTVGVVDGIFNAIIEGDLAAMSSGSVNTWLNEIDQIMESEYAHYYKRGEDEFNFLQKLGTGNFWYGELTPGIAYIAGSLAAEGVWSMATGGASLSTLALRMGNRGRKVRNFLKMGDTSRQMVRNATGAKSLDRLNAAGRFGKFVNTNRYILTTAGYDAASETMMFREAAMDEYFNHLRETNQEIDGASFSDLTTEIEDAARKVYYTNLAVVGTTSLALYGPLFNIKNPLKKVWNNTGDRVFKRGSYYNRETGKTIAREANKMHRTTDWVYSNLVRPAAYQGGWEAAQQHNIRETAADWIKAGYNEEYTRDQKGLYNAFLEKAGETYTTKEGWNSIGTGMFIGMFGRLTSLGSTGRRTQLDNYYKGMQNSYTTEKFMEGVKMMNRVRYGNELYTEAAEANNATGMLHAENSQAATVMDYHAKHGQLDQFLSDITFALNQTEASALSEMLGVEEAQATQARSEFLNNMKNTSKQVKRAREFAENFIGRGKLPKQVEGSREELVSNIAMIIAMNNLTERDIAKPFNVINTLFSKLDSETASKLKKALEAHTIFSKATASQQEQMALLKDRETTVTKRLQEVEDSLEGAGSFEGQVDTAELIALNRELESLTKELQEISTAAGALTSGIIGENRQGPYEDGNPDVITSSSKDHLALYESETVTVDGKEVTRLKALEPLKDYADSIRDSDPNTYEALNMGLLELERSVMAHKYYNDLVLGMRSGDFDLKSFSTKLGYKMFGGKPVNTFTEQLIVEAWVEGDAIKGHARNMVGQVVFAPELTTRKVDLKTLTNEELEDLRAEIMQEIEVAREEGNTELLTNLENDNDALANYIAERESVGTVEITRELVRSLNTLDKEYQNEVEKIKNTDLNKKNNEATEAKIEEVTERFKKKREELMSNIEETTKLPQEKSDQFRKEVEGIRNNLEDLEAQREALRNKETKLVPKEGKITVFGMQLTPAKSKVTDTTIDFNSENGTVTVKIVDAEGNVLSEVTGVDMEAMTTRAMIEVESQEGKTKRQKEGQKKRIKGQLKKFFQDFNLQDHSKDIETLSKELSNARGRMESREFQIKKLEEFVKTMNFLSLSTTEPFRAVVERLKATGMTSEVVMMNSKDMKSFLKKEGFTEEEGTQITNAIEVKKSIDALEQKPFKTKKGVSLNVYGNIDSIITEAQAVDGYSMYQGLANRLGILLGNAEVKEVKLSKRELSNFKEGKTVKKIEDSLDAQIIKVLDNKGDLVYYAVNDNGLTQEITKFKRGAEKSLQDKNLFSRARVRVVPNGISYQGKIYINSDTATVTTALHGFAHLYNQNLKETNRELYDQGLNLIEEEIALGIDSEISDVIEFVRTNQPGLTGEMLHQEVMAELTGRKGTEMLKARERDGSPILNWIRDAFNSIKEMLGLSTMTTEEAMALNVNEYSEAIASDLLSGEKLFSELIESRAVSEVLRKRMPTELDKGLKALTVEQADKAMANIFKENPNIDFQEVLNIIDTREITQWFNWENSIEGPDYWADVDFNVRSEMLGEGAYTPAGVNKLAEAFMKRGEIEAQQRVEGTRGDESDALIRNQRQKLEELAELTNAHNEELSQLEGQIKDNDSPETKARKDYLLKEAKEKYEANKEKVQRGEETGIETVDIVMALETFLFNNKELKKYLPEQYSETTEGAETIDAEAAIDRVAQDLSNKIEEFSELIAKELQGEELTVAEIQKYKSLEEDLAQVNILKGISLDIGIVDMDLAGMVELYNQMMFQAEDSSVHVTEVNSIEETNMSQSSRYNMVSAAQFPEGVWVKVNERGMYEVSQLPITTITENLQDSLIGQELSVDGGITFQPIDGDNIQSATKVGTMLTITTESGDPINIEVGEHGRLIVTEDTYTRLMDLMGTQAVVTDRNLIEGSHYAVYKKNGEGEIMTPLKNDIEFAQGDNIPIASSQEAFAADRVTFKVSTENSYNKVLLEDYKNAKTKADKERTLNAIRRETVIYMMTEEGKILGVMRAGDSNNGYLKSSNFAAVRIQASEIMIDSKGAGMVRDLKDSQGKAASARVSRKYQGDPVANLRQTTDGYERELREASMEERSSIVDFGYVQNGELVLKGDSKISYMVNYLPDNGKKTPVVVVDYGGQSVPLTVTVKPEAFEVRERLTEIINSDASEQDKTLSINKALMEKELAPRDYVEFFRQGLLQDENILESMVSQIEMAAPEVNVDVWINSQNTSTVGNSILTDKALTEFRRGKSIIGFTDMKDLPSEHISEAVELSKQVKVEKQLKKKVEEDNSTGCKK